MLLRKLQSPRTAVPVGMALISLGCLFSVTSQTFLRHFHSSTHWNPGTIDFFRGFCVGLGIAMEIAGLLAMLLARRRGSEPSSPQRS